MCEVIGFWLMFIGAVTALLSTLFNQKSVDWIEARLRIPWYMQICGPIMAIMIAMIGAQMWAIGNRGRYPGYPLDVIIEWWK